MCRLIILSLSFIFASLAAADSAVVELADRVHTAEATDATEAPASQLIEVAFSPEGGGESLVLKTISSAKSSIRLAAYAFTLSSLIQALINAKQRGVDVAVLVDYKNNLEDAHNNAPKHALNVLISAGIPARTISAYSVHHDKYMVVDERHTETGSFNYTTSAAKYNSENVIVIWNNPQIAKQYLVHWQSRWQQGQDYQPD